MNLYVSSSGCDTASGTQEHPFATVQKAKDAVRDLIAAGLYEPVTVHIAPGNYRVSPLNFTAEDSGTAEYPVTYQAEGNVTLNGGIALSAEMFVPVSEEVRACLSPDAADKVVCADLGALGITRSDYGEMCAVGSHNSAFLYDGAVISPIWCELFVNDVRQTIARYPNEGFLKLRGSIREGEGWRAATHADIPHDEWVQMRNPIADIYRIDEETAKRAAGWKHKSDLWMFGYPRHDWADMSTPIIGIDAEQCSMESKYVSMFGIMQESQRDDYHNGGGYYLYNVLDELDTPGEWYLDRDNAVLYLYPPCDLSEAEVMLSLATEPVLQFVDASHLTFRGFTVIGTRADGVGGSCSDVTLDGLTIKNVAGNGVNIAGERIVVKNCEIKETGRGGIRLDGGERVSLTHGENVAENNYIHDFSRIYQTYQSGIHLLGCGNIARHNEICRTPHQAIGYFGNEHIIEYNYIHHCTYASSDAGAIYSGYDWVGHGTVIRFNRIEHIGGDGFRPDGIYWDDGLSGQTAYGNILIDVKKFSLQLGGGHDNVFTGNLILESGDAALKVDCRYRDAQRTKGQFYDGIAWPDGKHWKRLAAVPYNSELWTEKYPHLGLLKADPAADADDPDFPPNPSYNTVSGNAVIAPRGKLLRVFPDVYIFSSVENNVEYASFAEAGVDPETFALLTDGALLRDIPDFAPIPAEKIGRLR